jgi:hypothetical protein
VAAVDREASPGLMTTGAAMTTPAHRKAKINARRSGRAMTLALRADDWMALRCSPKQSGEETPVASFELD